MTADTPTSPAAPGRRRFLQQGAAAGAGALFASLGHQPVWAAGSDAPEKREVKIGFIPVSYTHLRAHET